MSLYSISIFLHIVGALGLFGSIALEQASLLNLRRATTIAQIHDWVGLLGSLRRIDAPSGIFILATGFYMALTRWGQQAWIGLALLGMLVMAVLGIALTGRRALGIKRAISTEAGPVSAALYQRINDPILRTSASLRAAIALGIVFNMSVKPAPAGALAAMALALVLGAAVSFVGTPRRQAVSAPAHRGADA